MRRGMILDISEAMIKKRVLGLIAWQGVETRSAATFHAIEALSPKKKAPSKKIKKV